MNFFPKSLLVKTTLLLILAFTAIGSAYGETIDRWIDSPGIDEYPDVSSIILYDFIENDINSDYSRALVEHEVIKLLTKDSFSKFHKVSRTYLASSQNYEVEIARIIRPDGSVVNLQEGQDIVHEDIFSEKMPLYKDIQVLSLNYAAAQEGDIIEFKLVRTDKNPWLKNHFWGISFTRDEIPLLYTEFAAGIFNPDISIQYFTPRKDDGKMMPGINKHPKGRVYVWKLTNREPVSMEQGAPPLRNFVSSVMITTFKSMEEMSQVMYESFKETIEPADSVKTKTGELLKNINNPKDKVLTLARFINQIQTLDVGFDPDHIIIFNSSELLEADSLIVNDAQLLFIAMLKAAGIEAYPALMADQKFGDAYPEIASPYNFNRIVAAIKLDGKTYYVDANDPIGRDLAPYAGKQGRHVLELNPQGASLAKTPISPADDNLELITVDAELASDGSMGARMSLKESGTKRAFWESFMNTITDQGRRNFVFNQMVQMINDEARLLGVDLSKDEETDDMSIQITFMSEMYPLISGKYWIVKVPVIPITKIPDFLSMAEDERTQPILMGALGVETKKVTISIPDNFKVKSLPSPVNLKNSVGSLKVECSEKDSLITYHYDFRMEMMEIPPSLYAETKELYEKALRSSAEIILLEKISDDKSSTVGNNKSGVFNKSLL